ncbi:1-acylglycerol-3-phosphate O-acyltransferase [Cladochytrium tenue]|nr:1-acylglycerol-3-phosphate O-acyltransferase [Cladochytrium tenue]
MGRGADHTTCRPTAAPTAASSSGRNVVARKTGRKSLGEKPDSVGAAAAVPTDAVKKGDLQAVVYPRRAADIPLYLARASLYLQTLADASLWGMIVAPAFALMRQTHRANAHASGAVKVVGDMLLGIRVRMEGREHFEGVRPAVFICNHQSFLDLYMLGYVFPPDCAIVAKDDLFWAPFIGQYLYLGGNIFIDRQNSKSAIATMKFISQEMQKKKMGVFMFPEGTRSHQTTNDMLPFKKGPFYLAIEGQYPIIPIVVSTYGDVYNTKQLLFRGGDVRVRVLPPVSTEGLTIKDTDKLLEDTRNAMLSTLREISRPVSKL